MAIKEDVLFQVLADTQKAVAELRKLFKEFEKTGKAAKKAGEDAGKGGKSATPLFDFFNKIKGQALAATGILVGFGLAAKKAFDFGLAGAQVKQLSQSFDTMAASIGAPTDLLTQMRGAVNNTVSDMELMRGATVAMIGVTGEFGQELSAALPELLRIAKAAEKANPTLGDTGFLFNSLTVGLKRLSPRLIDNTGLQVKYGESLRKFADSVGKSTQELTAMEQQQALLQATLAAGQVLIDQVGGSTESLTDVYREFSANIENTKNELAALADVLVRRVVTGLNAVLFGNKTLIGALTEHQGNVRKTSESYEEYIDKVTRGAVAGGFLVRVVGGQIRVFKDTAFAMKDVTDQVGLLNEEQFYLIEVLGRLTEAEKDAAREAGSFDIAMQQLSSTINAQAIVAGRALTAQIEDLNREFGKLRRAAGTGVGEAFNKIGEAEEELAKKTSEIVEKLGDIAGVDLSVGQFQELAGIFEQLETASRQFSGSFSTEQSKIRTDIANWSKAIAELRDQEYVSKDDIGEIARLERKIRAAGQAFGESLTPAQVEANAEVTTLIAKIQEISGLPYWTPKQKEQLEGLVEELGEARSSFDEVKQAAIEAAQAAVFQQLGIVVQNLSARAGEAKKAFDELVESGTATPEQIDAAWANAEEAINDAALAKELYRDVGLETGELEAQDLILQDIIEDYEQALINSEGVTQELIDATIQTRNWKGEIDKIPPNIPVTVKLLGQEALEAAVKTANAIAGTRTVTVRTRFVGSEGRREQIRGDTGDEQPQGERQHGGAVLPNQPFLVGERRPEIFVPPSAGRIMPPGEQDRLMNQSFSNNVTINAEVSSGIDIEFLAHRVADVIYRKQRAGAKKV